MQPSRRPNTECSSLTPLELACEARGLRLTQPRRVIARVIEAAENHPGVDEICRIAKQEDPQICTATVYRTMKLFEGLNLVTKHRFGSGPARYELARTAPHDHLIDVKSGQIIEFSDPRIDAIQARLAEELGLRDPLIQASDFRHAGRSKCLRPR